MCKCKQAIEWDVDAEIDENAMQEGYDGDLEEGTDTSAWVAYQLISYARCTRCGEREDRDALGSCWVSEPNTTQVYLYDTVRDYGMVPKGAPFDLCIAW